MDVIKTVENEAKTFSLEDAAKSFLTRIDEGLDDFENGRIVSSEDLWDEVDKI